MKTWRISLIVALLLLVACSALAATLSVRADNWPPYNAEPQASKPGYMIELLKEIFEPQGVTVEYKLSPWTRALHDVNSGKFDAVVGTDRSESPEMVFPQESFGNLDNAMYVRNDNVWRYQGVASLKGKRLGVIDGYGYNGELDAYIENNQGKQVFAVSGDDALPKLIKMLQAGRIDVLVENVYVMNYTLGKLGVTNLVNAGKTDDEPLPLEFGLSPERSTSKNYARMFDEGIAKLRASGRLAEILKRYGVSDWK